jgi:glycosyltransferase involved in cell wall biosynthesis
MSGKGRDRRPATVGRRGAPSEIAELNDPTRVFGLLVTFDRPDELTRMISSLAGQTRPPDTVLVLDNGDPGPTAAALRRAGTAGPELEHVILGDNLGPAGALAEGASLLAPRLAPGDWVLLLDDDDPPTSPTQLAQLVDFGRRSTAWDPLTGAVGHVGARFDTSMARAVRLEDRELGDGPVAVDYLGGGVLPLYAASAVRATGLTRPELFFGFDDLDLGLRLQRAGMHLWVDGERMLERRTERGRLGTTPEAPPETPWRRYYSTRNLILVLCSTGSRRGAGVAALRALGGSTRGLLVRGDQRRWAHWTMTMRGIVDGVSGRTGRRVAPTAKQDTIAATRDPGAGA